MKVSSSAAKTTSPGRKQVWRQASGDVIGLADEEREGAPLLVEAMRGGRRVIAREDIATIRERSLVEVGRVRPAVLGGTWTVRRSARLEQLRSATLQRLQG